MNPFVQSRWLGLCWLGSALISTSALAAPAEAAASAPQLQPASGAACPALLNKTFLRLQDEKPQNLCQYSGKVLLVVNTASKCGFAGQFEGLEALYAKYKDQGLVVVGFPSADFMRQEYESGKEIADFCQNTYGVKFPMMAKTHVSGDDVNPLFADLIKQTGTRPKWNFYKYLIGRDGKTVKAYSTATNPKEADFIADVEKALGIPK
ncbi:MAG: glutathione peroxidase [Burkholderiales bacterium]|nr:glutathione peroxidase [Burkholderiales bacterium]